MIRKEILDEISFRLEEDYDLRFTNREIVESHGDFLIVQRNGWYGVMYGKEVCIPSIYDNIEIAIVGNRLVAQTYVMDKKGLWVLADKKMEEVIEPIYEDLIFSPYYDGVVFKVNGKEGLYCLARKKRVLEPKYECVTFNTASKHIWARENDNVFLFVDVELGITVSVAKAIVPLEHDKFSVYMTPDGHLEFVDGDSFLFRKLVVRSGGRLKMSNSRSGKIYITDATGFILNT